jgi:hypothetical protein
MFKAAQGEAETAFGNDGFIYGEIYKETQTW